MAHMANIGDLVLIKSTNEEVWYYNPDDQPYPYCSDTDISGVIVASMVEEESDSWELGEYWLTYDREFLEGTRHREGWKPFNIFVVKTSEGFLLTYTVKVISKLPGATKTKKGKGFTGAFSKFQEEMRQNAERLEQAGVSPEVIKHFKARWNINA